VTEAVMLANDVKVETLVALVKQGLATATPQRVRAGRETLEVATLRITEAGRKALAGMKSLSSAAPSTSRPL